MPGLILVWLAGFTLPVTAQQKPLLAARYALKISPQHLLVNGLALELERKPEPGSRHSFTFSPRLYLGRTLTTDKFAGREKEEVPAQVQGFGAEFMHRIYQVSGSEQRLYYAYGLNYHRFNIHFETDAWLEEAGSDGLNYYVFKTGTFLEKINRFGGVGVVGLQRNFFRDKVFTDIFTGIGYQYSYLNSSFPNPRYNANMLDFGNTGLYLTTGLKIGFWL